MSKVELPLGFFQIFSLLWRCHLCSAHLMPCMYPLIGNIPFSTLASYPSSSSRRYDAYVRSNPNILVISFSDIRRDARLLRQLSVVKDFGHVTTLGYGTQPAGSDEQLQT